ncbi:MAG: aspartate 1-decarboxylase [Pseudomonadota bacterium]
MLRNMLKSKIHRAYVTDADVHYEGSITLDPDLMDAALFIEFEQVHVWDVTNGQRIVTYVMEGERGLGTVAINGAAAHLIKKDDIIIIGSYAVYDETELTDHCMRRVYVDAENRVKKVERSEYRTRNVSCHSERSEESQKKSPRFFVPAGHSE